MTETLAAGRAECAPGDHRQPDAGGSKAKPKERRAGKAENRKKQRRGGGRGGPDERNTCERIRAHAGDEGRKIGLLIVAADAQSEQPKMWHLPHEQEERQRKNRAIHGAAGADPANGWRNGANDRTDDRCYRAYALEVRVKAVVPDHGESAEARSYPAAAPIKTSQGADRQARGEGNGS